MEQGPADNPQTHRPSEPGRAVDAAAHGARRGDGKAGAAAGVPSGGAAPARKGVSQSGRAPEAELAETIAAPKSAGASGTLARIGHYFIKGTLGEGGMGIVYKAEQKSPIRRLVALKLIKPGFDSREVIGRFQSERQALARMDHPHIAKVHDAGMTELGRPYFVMEYVPGVPITWFADQQRLSIPQRLKLFISVCEAIAHAHAKAIIHRDIKASNVLAYVADGKPMVKVIDFGIAKALTGENLADQTLDTLRGQVMGTYAYMSPEQADASPDIDTRTDVYSLGVLLYELLTGAMPIDRDTFAKAAPEEIRRVIREVEVPRPSTRLSSLGNEAVKIAVARRSRLDALIGELRNELEWIPLMAMRKERERRYSSPLELAEDIHNYLEQRPLLAGPESKAYVLRKFARRNRAPLAAAAAIMALLVGGVTVSTTQWVRARRAEQTVSFQLGEVTREKSEVEKQKGEVEKQKQEVERQKNHAIDERDNAQAVLDYLTDVMLAGARPERIRDVHISDAIVKAMIEPATREVGTRFAGKPLVEASVRNAIAMTLEAIGRGDLALPHAQSALEIRRKVLGEDHPDTIKSEHVYGFVLESLQRSKEAEPLFKDALERGRRVRGEDHPDTIKTEGNYALILLSLGRLKEAEPLCKDALERCRKVQGEDHLDTLRWRSVWAHILDLLGRSKEAEPLFKEVLERRRKVQGEDHPDTIIALIYYAHVLQSVGRLEEAEPLCKEALERCCKVLGEDHRNTLKALSGYGLIVKRQGRRKEAEPIFKEAMQRTREVLGEDDPDTIWSLNNYADLVRDLGRAEEAEPLFQEAVRKADASPKLGRGHADTRRYANNLATCLDALHRPAEAAAVRAKFALAQPTTRRSTTAANRSGEGSGKTLVPAGGR
jgi:serine/threonine protein kinase